MLRVAVCVSGGGTNLQAIIDALKCGKIRDAQIIRVISNNELRGCPFDADSCTVCQEYVLRAIRAFAKQEPDI